MISYLIVYQMLKKRNRKGMKREEDFFNQLDYEFIRRCGEDNWGKDCNNNYYIY